MFKNLFKSPTRQEEIKAVAEGLAHRLKNHDYTAEEILQIYELMTIDLVLHLEALKSDTLIAKKKANTLYKKTSFSLTTLRLSKESLETNPSK